MNSPQKKHRMLSRKLSSWHLVVLAAVFLVLIAAQYALNKKAEKERVADIPVIEDEIQTERK